EVLDLPGTGEVRLVRRGAHQVGEAFLGEAVEQGSAQQGAAAGDVDARGALHDASAAGAGQARSLKGRAGWSLRRRAASREAAPGWKKMPGRPAAATGRGRWTGPPGPCRTASCRSGSTNSNRKPPPPAPVSLPPRAPAPRASSYRPST